MISYILRPFLHILQLGSLRSVEDVLSELDVPIRGIRHLEFKNSILHFQLQIKGKSDEKEVLEMDEEIKTVVLYMEKHL